MEKPLLTEGRDEKIINLDLFRFKTTDEIISKYGGFGGLENITNLYFSSDIIDSANETLLRKNKPMSSVCYGSNLIKLSDQLYVLDNMYVPYEKRKYILIPSNNYGAGSITFTREHLTLKGVLNQQKQVSFNGFDIRKGRIFKYNTYDKFTVFDTVESVGLMDGEIVINESISVKDVDFFI